MSCSDWRTNHEIESKRRTVPASPADYAARILEADDPLVAPMVAID
jgi:hypothetical protein